MGKIVRHNDLEVYQRAMFAARCSYLTREQADSLYRAYEVVVRTIVGMSNHPET